MGQFPDCRPHAQNSQITLNYGEDKGPSMAIHPNTNSLTIEVIEEYLDIAKLCIATKKSDGGIYGYPATLLLFCVIDALGNCLISGKEPFRVLKGAPFNCDLTDSQIKNLEQWYRNLLAHNGTIAAGTCLSPKEGSTPFEFASNKPILICVKSLYDLVRTAWKQVDKTKLNVGLNSHANPKISDPVDFSGGSLSVPITASGANYIPTLTGQREKKKSKRSPRH
jgi:hypothetical protein